MDDFKRMMEMDGVVPLGAKPHQGARRRASAPTMAPATTVTVGTPPASAGAAWVAGPAARRALTVALDRCAGDPEGTWGHAVAPDGSSRRVPIASGAAALLAEADRLDARLVVLGGSGWTFVLHPSMGVATLDDVPGELPG